MPRRSGFELSSPSHLANISVSREVFRRSMFSVRERHCKSGQIMDYFEAGVDDVLSRAVQNDEDPLEIPAKIGGEPTEREVRFANVT